MRFFHLSDLHLGKRVNGFSLIEDQKYILDRIISCAADERPDALIIAGDVFDRSVPPVEAVELFDDLLVRLSELSLPVFIISGNHDSAERLAFGARIMEGSDIHISPAYDGEVMCRSLEDEFGRVNIHLLPFIKPVHARRFFPDEDTSTFTSAMRTVIDHMDIDRDERNILVTHQFVTGAATSDSEELYVGGTENIDGSVFGPFDYVALGHIHRPQNVGDPRIRYCGSPLKYSFSEAPYEKSITVVEMKEKGRVETSFIPLVPLRDMREVRGSYEDLMEKSSYEGTTLGSDYVHITLTDENEIPDAVSRLRVVYRNIMKMDYDNTRTRTMTRADASGEVESRSPGELFAEFYEKQNGAPMSEEQRKFTAAVIEDIWEDEI